MRRLPAAVLAVVTAALASLASLAAQDRLRSMPGYDQYRRMAPQLAGAWTSGAVNARWQPDSRAFTYARGGQTYRFDLATMSAAPVNESAAAPQGARGGRVAPPVLPALIDLGAQQAQNEMPTGPIAGCPPSAIARGRQAFCMLSPDGRQKAFYRARNLWIANADGSGETRITSDGSERTRIKYGIASWVYGEELSQATAMWWSPDSRKLAFYRFDETRVPDFYVTTDQTGVQDAVDVEAYPKAGAPNPLADIYTYDLASRATTKLDVRDGRPFDNGVGHYVYNVEWRSDSRDVLLNRADRRQQTVEFTACAVDTGACRAIVREQWPTGWIETDGAPSPRWLSDRHRFIWTSSRNGWTNFYLYDLSGRLIAPLTQNAFEGVAIVKVDEAAGVIFYTARDGDNFLKIQVHRVGLDGRGDRRLTDPAFSHSAGNCAPPVGGSRLNGAPVGSCGISPDDKYIVDVYQRHDLPPATQLLDADGRVVAQVSSSDTSRLDQLGFRHVEQFAYKAADGLTTLYGQIAFPSNFDPAKKYPVLVPVYGGPAVFRYIPTETFAAPNATAEYGFLIVNVMYRGVPGLGKRGEDAQYLKLGQTEMDDIAAGVKALWDRPYVDKDRVGIYGTSYGGYTAAMEVMRHPDVFAAASASSPVTDWRNYDSIYTERYMWLPDENEAGYSAGDVKTYVGKFNGRLLLYYGTADNNVHPGNTLQLIAALQRAGKGVELEVGPDQPHGEVNTQRMMEFFIDSLVIRPGGAAAR